MNDYGNWKYIVYIKIGLAMVTTPLFVSQLIAGKTCHSDVHDTRGIHRALRDQFEVHRCNVSLPVINLCQDGLRESHNKACGWRDVRSNQRALAE